MMTIKKILTLTIIVANIFLCLSQDITFNHLSTNDGLSQVTAMSLYQDERGFIWIGTREGLNCYNSNGIVTYKQQKSNPNSLFSNNIFRLTGNGNGKIYFLGTSGLAEYDFEKDKFTTLLQSELSALFFNKKLYVARQNEILSFDEQKSIFIPMFKIPNEKAIISCLFVDGDAIWMGTRNNGVYLLKNKKTLVNVISKGNISTIYKDSKAKIWIGSWENGLFCFDKNTILNYTNNPTDDNSLSSNFVRALCEDDMGNLWIGTFNGLNKFDIQNNKFSNFQASDKPGGLSHSSIWSIIKDKQGTIWLGTYFGGVNYFNAGYEIYTHYSTSENEEKGLSSPIVGKMIEDKQNNLWICTEGGGLNIYNRHTKTFKWFKHSKTANTISHNNVKAIYYDEKNEVMWIGTHLGGLNKLDIKTNQFTNYKSVENDASTIPSNVIRDIVPYNNQLIVATENGACLFNPATGKCFQLFSDIKERDLIRNFADLQFDHAGTLWMAVYGQGVFSYRFDTNKLTQYKRNHAIKSSISNNIINSIYQDSNHNLWFCTSGSGLDLYRYKTDDFENFDVLNYGLSSDCVYEVTESDSRTLLIITNQGFSRFDIKNKKIYNYNSKNGFPFSAINENALYKTHDGEVFLGGVQGMISFYEKNLNFTPKPYKITPNRLYVNGKEVHVNDETGLLNSSLNNTKKITFHSDQNVFSIEFATSNYISANQSDIVYMLEGFSKEWTSTRGQNIVTYTNLNPGKYKLLVKDNSSKDSPRFSLHIEVLPPFYRTGLAYLLYAIIIGGIIFYFLRVNNNKIKLEASLKYEQKHIQDVENLNQAKLRFFTNISHEFRTPLTLIIAQMEILIHAQSFTPDIYNKILGVYKNGLRLRELISELLDFRKQEAGHMKIKVSKHNIVDFLYENYLLFLEYASTRKINFVFNKEVNALDVWYDTKQMQKVINNLLSNAFKHTSENESITISVKQTDNEVVICIADTGVGIDVADVDKIFDRFYQTNLSEASSFEGTGIGLALTKGIVELHHGTVEVKSSLNVGTDFIIKLKLGNDHYEQVQLVEDDEEIVNQTVNFDKIELDQNTDVTAFNEKLWEISDKKMVIVEDNSSLRETLVEIFKPYYHVITAENGEIGLEKIRSESPCIVLSDVLMPKMSGTELCKLIKDDVDTCHIPVVLLTARTAVEHTLQGLRVGADDYITKPFNSTILVSRCNNLVNSRIVLQEKFSNQPQITPQMLATNVLDKVLLDKAMVVIEKYIDDTEFNIHVFSKEMGMSRTKLFDKIKGITGQTPIDFVANIRLKKAAIMLRSNLELNITEISELLGFNTARYFSTCFKNQYHVSPLSYRKGLSVDEDDTSTE